MNTWQISAILALPFALVVYIGVRDDRRSRMRAFSAALMALCVVALLHAGYERIRPPDDSQPECERHSGPFGC